MTKQNVKSTPRKYPVIEMLHKHFSLNYTKALNSLIQHAEISKKTFYNDMAIPAHSDKTVPKGRLVLYAEFFGIDYTDLITKPETDDSLNIS